MTISAIIINNVNQQSNRAQLRDAAMMIANIVSEEVDVFQHSIDNELTQISTTLEYYNSPEKADEYLRTIINNMPFYEELAIAKPNDLKNYERYRLNNNYSVFTKEQKNGDFLVAVLDMKNLKENLFKTLEQNKRQIYVLAGEENRLVASVNYEQDIFESSIAQLPRNLQKDKSVIYGKVKNQPIAYHKKTRPNITIIVPADEAETIAAVKYAAEIKTPVYIRISRSNLPDVFESSHKFNFEKAIRLNPSNKDYIYNAAVCHELLGDKKSAEEIAVLAMYLKTNIK